MARFLFTVWPFAGHVHPNVAIARALAARGHETAFYTGSSIASALESERLRVFPFHALNEERVTRTVQELDALSLEWRKARARKAMIRDWFLGTVDAQLQDIGAIVKQWQPDALVCDPAMWGPILVLHETTFEIAHGGEILVELLLVAFAEFAVEFLCLTSDGVENAAPALHTTQDRREEVLNIA